MKGSSKANGENPNYALRRNADMSGEHNKWQQSANEYIKKWPQARHGFPRQTCGLR
jgi:hypothetical protein